MLFVSTSWVAAGVVSVRITTARITLPILEDGANGCFLRVAVCMVPTRITASFDSYKVQ